MNVICPRFLPFLAWRFLTLRGSAAEVSSGYAPGSLEADGNGLSRNGGARSGSDKLARGDGLTAVGKACLSAEEA